MKTIQVKDTKSFETSYKKEIQVVLGTILSDREYPIIISETEKFKEGDLVLNLSSLSNQPFTLDKKGEEYCDKNPDHTTRKVLATYMNFSKKQLNAIWLKLSSGDKVLVECEEILGMEGIEALRSGKGDFRIKLDKNTKEVTLHPFIEKTFTESQILEALDEPFGQGSLDRDEYRSRVLIRLGY